MCEVGLWGGAPNAYSSRSRHGATVAHVWSEDWPANHSSSPLSSLQNVHVEHMKKSIVRVMPGRANRTIRGENHLNYKIYQDIVFVVRHLRRIKQRTGRIIVAKSKTSKTFLSLLHFCAVHHPPRFNTTHPLPYPTTIENIPKHPRHTYWKAKARTGTGSHVYTGG